MGNQASTPPGYPQPHMSGRPAQIRNSDRVPTGVPDQDGIARAALQAFFGITADWGLDAEQQRVLLGSPSRSAFYNLRRELAGRLSVDQLDRISYVMGIHKALSILLPDPAAVRRWVHAPNAHPLFAGRSALAKMTDGHLQDLAEIRRYLDAERGA